MKIWQQNMPIYWILYHNSCTELCSMPDIKEILSMKCFSENKWWWWLRESREEQRKRWKECGMTGRDRRGTGPHAMGGLRGRLQRCLIDTQSHRYCQGPSQSSEKQSTIRSDCEQTNTPVQTLKMTGRNTQKDINTHRHTARKKGIPWHVMSESKVAEVFIHVSATGKKS